jgi:Mg/Co/Ni transporter MgtE
MSPRAAWRLERLGFPRVYDYVPGKMDWLSFGLPHEGSALLAGEVIDADVPRCHLDERMGEVRTRLGEQAGFCVAVEDDGVVMGVVQDEGFGADPEARVEDAMAFGVSTIRPSEDVEALLGRMRHAGIEAILVTRSDGRLMGLLRREEAEGVLQGQAFPRIGRSRPLPARGQG